MRIIVSDSAALIDLKKGGLLEIFTRLPFDIVVPEDILADELLSFTKGEIALMRRTMTVAVLNAGELLRVQSVLSTSPALSVHDGTALIVAGRKAGSILLTGDRRLREKAEEENIECHGVLWALEEMDKAKLAPAKVLLKALQAWHADTFVRLPRKDLDAIIAKFQK